MVSCLLFALGEALFNVVVVVGLLVRCVFMILMGSHIKNLQLKRYIMLH